MAGVSTVMTVAAFDTGGAAKQHTSCFSSFHLWLIYSSLAENIMKHADNTTNKNAEKQKALHQYFYKYGWKQSHNSTGTLTKTHNGWFCQS